MRFTPAFMAGCGVLIVAGCNPPPPADLVVQGGRIYTLAGEPPATVDAEPTVEAFAVRDGRIVFAGTAPDVQRLVGAGTRMIQLQGDTVLPGFVDCHVHLANLGRSLIDVNLVGTTSWDAVVARVDSAAKMAAPGAWITGRGWDQNDWPEREFPDHAALSAAIGDHPVYLRRVDGHAAIANAMALTQGGIGSDVADPSGGRILRRKDGTPTGVLVDAATELVTAHIPPSTPAERRLRLERAFQHCVHAGLTGVHDAGMAAADIDVVRAMLATGDLPLRLYAMWDATPDTDDHDVVQRAVRAGPEGFDPTMHFALCTVKLAVDGALGSRGAALLAPYADAPGESGLPQYTLETFLERARPLHAAGFQLATHCIGDAANRLVLDAYQQLAKETPRPNARHRIEHAQVLAPEDIRRVAALGVLPSMQPTHCTSDMPWAPDRLGPARIAGAYAWRSLRQTGVILPGGSDAPVESIEPLLGVYAAITRQDRHGFPPQGWAADQCLTRSEALRAFTSWAAVASFTEHDLGTLETGKRADFVVLDRDVLHVPAAEILATRVLLTVVGGQTVSASRPKP